MSAHLDARLRELVDEHDERALAGVREHVSRPSREADMGAIAVEAVRPTAQGRRQLDRTLLDEAARRAGFSSSAAAVVAALETLGARQQRQLVGEIFRGVLPGAFVRRAICALLAVDESLLWPAVTP